RSGDRGELEFAAGEFAQSPVPAASEADLLEDPRGPSSGLAHELESRDRLVRQPVYVLGFHDAANLPLRDPLEVGVERGPSVVGEDLGPVGRVVVIAQVGDVGPGEEPERRRFTGSVRSEESGDPSGRGNW